jgi:hypothetical protein
VEELLETREMPQKHWEAYSRPARG